MTLSVSKMGKYKIYHIPKYVHKCGSVGKIGVTVRIHQRIGKNKQRSLSPFDDWEILEEHDDIIEVSYREIELQKEYGYKEDKKLYYTQFKYYQKQFKGKNHTKEAKDKIREGNLGRKCTNKQKKRMSVAQKGLIKSEEHKKAISEGRMGIKLSDEHKSKIGDSLRKSKKYKEAIKKRDIKGEKGGLSILTNEKVLYIRQQYSTDKYSVARLCRAMGVSWSTIDRVVKRITWSHI